MKHLAVATALVVLVVTPVHAETCTQRETICMGHCPQRNKTAERIEKCRRVQCTEAILPLRKR
jgi:hypothetical protein